MKRINFFRKTCKYSVNTSSRGREAIGRGDPGLSGLPRPAKSSGARNDGRILTKILTIPFIIFIFFIFFLWRGLSLKPSLIPSPLIHKPAPTFTLPNILDPENHTSEKDFLGHVTLVNVWATWCETCVYEHDFLVESSKNNPDILFYGLNYKDELPKVRQWLKSYDNPYKIIAFDGEGRVAIDWGVYGTPETFILDKKGIIRYKYIGALNQAIWQKEFAPLIQQLESENA
jgi:cytochrome c biogenesis protein CcmG, thiol:disulfide interchange protein DsbE